MAKKKELTIEEKLEQEKRSGLSNIKTELSHINEPSYFFNIGDKVRYGNLKESIVDEVLYGGKVYGLKCIATNDNYGNLYDYETYRVVSWVAIRPLTHGTTDFTENQDIRLNYNNTRLRV